MPRFSANLGFLWADLALPDAIDAACRAGFDAVECHWPYGEDLGRVQASLRKTGLPLLSLNTEPGDVTAGEFGLAAVPGRNDTSRATIDKALDWGARLGAGAVHVMAGNAQGAEARRTFLDALRYAADKAEQMTILIEPLNPFDVPGYFLHSTQQACDLIADAGRSNIRLMFDFYHVARAEGDAIQRLRDCLPVVGHIQFAGVPDRGAPDTGVLDYRRVFDCVDALGWDKPLGAEYRPGPDTGASLGWMRDLTT